MKIVFAVFISLGAAFQILAVFLLKLSFAAVDLPSWFQSLEAEGLSCLSTLEAEM